MTALLRLALGLLTIVLLSAGLLLSDLSHRHVPKVAILQHASTEVLDAGVRGMIAGLAEEGFEDGRTMDLERFNSEGNLGLANQVARQVVSGGYAVILTSSTPSMQAVATANQDGRVVHVFGLVANPFGLGLSKERPLDHPKHLVGYGTMVPVKRAFELAMKMYPGLKRIGCVWNSGESNSVAFTTAARKACAELNLELLEANVNSSAGITEAVASLLSRDAQAIWVGGDNTVMMGLPAVLQSAKRGHIPVFSILPGTPDRGTLFDMGVDFQEVGRMTGKLAARVLQGEDTTKIPIEDIADKVPLQFSINKKMLADLKDPWRIPDDVLKQATAVVDETGVHQQKTP